MGEMVVLLASLFDDDGVANVAVDDVESRSALGTA